MYALNTQKPTVEEVIIRYKGNYVGALKGNIMSKYSFEFKLRVVKE